MRLKKLNDKVIFNSLHKRYAGSRYFYYPARYEEDLRQIKIGYAERHYVHNPNYCDTIYYIK